MIYRSEILDFKKEVTQITGMLSGVNMGVRRCTMDIINVVKIVQLFLHEGEKKYHQSEYGEYVL